MTTYQYIIYYNPHSNSQNRTAKIIKLQRGLDINQYVPFEDVMFVADSKEKVKELFWNFDPNDRPSILENF